MSGGDFLVATVVTYLCFRILGPVEYPAGVEYPLADTAPLVGLLFAILMYLSDSYALEYKDFARSASAVLIGGAISLSVSLFTMLVLALAERKLCIVTTTITTL